MKFQQESPERGIVKGEYYQNGEFCLPCWHCDELTNFFDIDFGTYLCSEECQDAKIEEYMRAQMLREEDCF